ncbi:MAG: SoxR reducing system RseC family protein [Bacteroidales bacterium]|jgi:sigma-E factor negative regulatory protein RseC|nr:SoxR reducing system RseC family protein [Bacteroidales bacterium]
MKETERPTSCNTEEGIITSIVEKQIIVRIQKREACSSCAVKSACEKTSTKGKDILVIEKNPELYTVGEKVTVKIPEKKAMKAVMIAFVYPMLLIILSISLTSSVFHLSDPLIALFAVIIILIYYSILYLLRDKSFFNFNISIEKITE